MIDPFIKEQLDNIEQAAKLIVAGIRSIYGYCAGVGTVASHLPQQDEGNAPTAQISGIINESKN